MKKSMSYQFREGRFMWDQAEELFPICRSITGEGLRHTLSHLQNIIPEIEIKEVPSGQQIFDWTIPNEWNVRDAFILTPNGEKIANFRENNLHLVSYSEPIQKKLSLDELQPHLHSIPDKPDLVPYRTSYYRRDWGFCMPHNLRQKLQQGTYEVFIDTKLEPGFLNYAELYISGQSKEEIMFSTYCCHPSLANDNLSGVVLALALAMGLQEREKLRHSYRFLWTPETIGALAWLHDNLDHAKESVKAGFVLTCVGDEGPFSYMPSRTGKTLADRLICAVLLANELPYCAYSFHQRGSDERQFCHPNIDLPFASLMRSKYDEFDEYHTSADNMDFLSKNALQETYDLHMQMIELLEENRVYTPTTVGEPQLGKRNLYSSLSKSVLDGDETIRYKILGYADGKLDLLSLTEIVKAPPPVIIEQIQKLVDAKVLELVT